MFSKICLPACLFFPTQSIPLEPLVRTKSFMLNQRFLRKLSKSIKNCYAIICSLRIAWDNKLYFLIHSHMKH